MDHPASRGGRARGDRRGLPLPAPRRLTVSLVLDHLILRAADPQTVVLALRDAELPVLAPVTPLAGGAMHSAIVEAGPVDVAVLAVGREPPAEVQGYGLGLRAPGRDLLTVARRQ